MAQLGETATPLMRWCLFCPAKRYVLQVQRKTFRLVGRITLWTGQRVPNYQTGDWESPSPKILRPKTAFFHKTWQSTNFIDASTVKGSLLSDVRWPGFSSLWMCRVTTAS